MSFPIAAIKITNSPERFHIMGYRSAQVYIRFHAKQVYLSLLWILLELYHVKVQRPILLLSMGDEC